MKARLRSESGFSLLELMMVMLLTGFVTLAVVSLMVSGLRTSSASSARVQGQGDARTAIDRLEYEARCASGATVSGSGSTVLFTLPSQCTHASGSYTWCVSGTSLTRTLGSTCSASGQVFATGVSTATPFTLLTSTGLLPRLQIALTVNDTHASNTAVSINDVITLRNAVRS